VRSPEPAEPGPDQESVWDYPRPPRLEHASSTIEIVLGGVSVVRTDRALRVLETSHPPTYYVPMSAFLPGSLRPCAGQSLCEWKGTAVWFLRWLGDLQGAGSVQGRAGHPVLVWR